MFTVCGLNHKTAPLSVREAYAIPPDPAQLQQFSDQQTEVAILSTCNRTEIYCTNQAPGQALHWMQHHYAKTDISLAPYTYTYEGTSAVSHLLRVASGLDSMVLGEPQILGQLKQAYQLACQAGTSGALLNRLFQYVFAAAKTVRTQTGIGQHPLSIAYAGVQLVKQTFDTLDKQHVLLIGAGQTSALVARYLRTLGVGQITIANRDVMKALKLAEQVDGQGICLSGFGYYLDQVDVVISATDAGNILLHADDLKEARTRSRSRSPVLLLDLAVPRNIAPDCAHLPNTRLYTVDDLKTIVAQSASARQRAAMEAEALVTLHTEAFMAMLRRLDATDTICDYRDKMQSVCDTLTTQAHRQIDQGQCPKAVLNELATRVRQKLLHAPTILMRQLGEQGQWDTLHTITECFALQTQPAEK